MQYIASPCAIPAQGSGSISSAANGEICPEGKGSVRLLRAYRFEAALNVDDHELGDFAGY